MLDQAYGCIVGMQLAKTAICADVPLTGFCCRKVYAQDSLLELHGYRTKPSGIGLMHSNKPDKLQMQAGAAAHSTAGPRLAMQEKDRHASHAPKTHSDYNRPMKGPMKQLVA